MSVLNTTSTLSNEVAVLYYKVFLERARAMLVHQEGAQMQGLDGNVGKEVIFNRFRPLALATTPLAESINPAPVQLTDDQVTVTLEEFGNSVQVSRLLGTTDVDSRDKEKIDVVAQNMGETLDALVRNGLYSGATALPGYTPGSGNLTAALCARSNAVLKENKALAYPGVFPWIAKIQPNTEYDLMQDTTWQNAAIYSNVQAIYEAEIGALFGSRFLVSNQGYEVAGTPNVMSNFFHGREAFGVYDNKLDPPDLYIVTGADSANPTERFHSLSWAGQFATTVLNDKWILDVATASSIT